MDLIVKVGLSKTIFNVSPFYPRLIPEFIVNLPSKFNDPSSSEYQTIHIRGSQFKISPSVINSFLGNTISSNSTPPHPSNDELAFFLFSGTLSVWLVNGIPTMSLNVKYPILYRIGIASWFPSSHASSVSATFTTFLYQICTNPLVDAELFIYNQLLRHMGTFGVKILIPLPRFFFPIYCSIYILTLLLNRILLVLIRRLYLWVIDSFKASMFLILIILYDRPGILTLLILRMIMYLQTDFIFLMIWLQGLSTLLLLNHAPFQCLLICYLIEDWRWIIWFIIWKLLYLLLTLLICLKSESFFCLKGECSGGWFTNDDFCDLCCWIFFWLIASILQSSDGCLCFFYGQHMIWIGSVID